MICDSEEDGRAALCAALIECINAEGGNLPPPKKRGVGAEIFSLVHELLNAKISEFNSSAKLEANDFRATEYNPIICMKYYNLVSLALAVVDAMQRSSGKQFGAVCTWACSYDIRLKHITTVLK